MSNEQYKRLCNLNLLTLDNDHVFDNICQQLEEVLSHYNLELCYLSHTIWYLQTQYNPSTDMFLRFYATHFNTLCPKRPESYDLFRDM